MNKSEKIILIIVAIIAVILIIYFGFINKGAKFVYYITKSNTSSSNTLIEDYSSFEKLASKVGISEKTITNQNDFSKSNILETFDEEYFNTKKVAVIVTYEDDSSSYIFSVDDVKYSSDKTSATIYYTDKKGEYLGPLKNSHYNYMLVELNNSVKDVAFEKTIK